jgi:hypothetical protein
MQQLMPISSKGQALTSMESLAEQSPAAVEMTYCG